MKLPSFRYLASSAGNSFSRFPLTILSSLAMVVTSIYLIETEGRSGMEILPFLNIILVSGLGIPAYFCAAILAEKYFSGKRSFIILNLIVTGLLLLVYFNLPDVSTTLVRSRPYFRFAFYDLAMHLTVSFIPFFFESGFNGFWQYNKILFLRFLTAALYSGFLTLGIFAALFALDQLFDIKFDGKVYPEIAISFAGLFNTWFFVSGIPRDFGAIERSGEYPKGLRIFCQYVLLPLLCLYLVILYAYGAKILITGDWPRGIVSYLIICVSVVGILSFLLLYPYGNQEGNSWMKKASRAYYFALLPLLLLLFLAILMRIDDYGITVNRYIILALGIWLAAVSIYSSIGRTNIRFIPSSLAALLLIISFGPWGIFSVSERYQVKRLRGIYERAGILSEGRIVNQVMPVADSSGRGFRFPAAPNDSKLNDSLRKEVCSILDYLDSEHGFDAISGWYGIDMDSLVRKQLQSKENKNMNETDIYLGVAGLSNVVMQTEYVPEYSIMAGGDADMVASAGYDHVLRIERYDVRDEEVLRSFEINGMKYSLQYSKKYGSAIRLSAGSDTLAMPLASLFEKLDSCRKNQINSLPAGDMITGGVSASLYARMVISRISIKGEGKSASPGSLTGYLLLRRKGPVK